MKRKSSTCYTSLKCKKEEDTIRNKNKKKKEKHEEKKSP